MKKTIAIIVLAAFTMVPVLPAADQAPGNSKKAPATEKAKDSCPASKGCCDKAKKDCPKEGSKDCSKECPATKDQKCPATK